MVTFGLINREKEEELWIDYHQPVLILEQGTH